MPFGQEPETIAQPIPSRPVELRAVFFDAGETLVHPHPSFPELLTRVLRDQGHEVDEAFVRDRLWVVSDRFLRASQENELWSTSAERSKAFWSSIYETFLGELGIEWTQHLAEVLYETFTDLSNYRLFDDVLDPLEALQERGLSLGLVSNFEEWLERLLESLDLIRFFDVRVISGSEGVEKPDPRIFEVALDRAGVEPKESAYVGDNVHFDIEPAQEVGMLAVLLDRRGRYPDHEGLRITTMGELAGALGL
jgi:putative hydrolase of the HAD superfamily